MPLVFLNVSGSLHFSQSAINDRLQITRVRIVDLLQACQLLPHSGFNGSLLVQEFLEAFELRLVGCCTEVLLTCGVAPSL